MNTLKIGDKFYCRYGYEMMKWKVITVGKIGVYVKQDVWFFPTKNFFSFDELEERDFIQV